MARQKRWLVAIGALVVVGFIVLAIAGQFWVHRFDPYIRQQVILYLQQRFDSEVEVTSLRVRLPNISALKLFLTSGRGSLAHLEGDGLTLRLKGRRDVPPLFRIKTFSAQLDLGTLFNTPKTVHSILIDGMDLTLPPKDDSANS